MQVTKAEFKCSSEKISQVPKDDLRDVAFIGRSNVGKSSLINMLTGRKGLAKVSSTPGKTRLINHFCINNQWYLVDLPGYGYARVSKNMRGEFSKIILDYVLKCEKMHFLFVLVDSRLEPQAIDLRFILLLLVQTAVFTAMYMVLPNKRNKLMDSLPGALLASIGWLVFSDLYSIYVAHFAGYANIYGSVYAVALSMLWLYCCISILFYGGALNHYLMDTREQK